MGLLKDRLNMLARDSDIAPVVSFGDVAGVQIEDVVTKSTLYLAHDT